MVRSGDPRPFGLRGRDPDLPRTASAARAAGGGLTCGEAEATLSKRLDGILAPAEQRALRAHLRECRECATLERKQRAQRAALKRLGVVELPPSLAGFLGGGAGSTVRGIVAGSGIAAKAAAIVAAGVLAGGVGHQAVEAVAAREPSRTELPRLKQVPSGFPKVYPSTAARDSKQADPVTAVSFAPVDESDVRAAVGNALARPGAGAATSQPSAGAALPSVVQPGASATAPAEGGAAGPGRCGNGEDRRQGGSETTTSTPASGRGPAATACSPARTAVAAAPASACSAAAAAVATSAAASRRRGLSRAQDPRRGERSEMTPEQAWCPGRSRRPRRQRLRSAAWMSSFRATSTCLADSRRGSSCSSRSGLNTTSRITTPGRRRWTTSPRRPGGATAAGRER